jgi:thioredoxin-related protein
LIKFLNQNYYAISFDAESEAEVRFGSKIYTNKEVGKSRMPLHDIAKLLATRGGEFVAPTLVVLDKDFKILGRYFKYMTSEELMEILN